VSLWGIELSLWCEDALGTVEFNAFHKSANNRVWVVGASLVNKKPCKDNRKIVGDIIV